MISPQFRPLIGGYERAAERVCQALAEARLRIVVITEQRDPTWPTVEIVDGYEIRRLPCLYLRHFHAVTSALSFGAFLWRHGREFDVWHVHQYGLHAALAVALGRACKRPVALKMTSSSALGIERALGKGTLGRTLAFFHRRVNACIAVSEETRGEAIRFGIPAERTYLIPNGVDGRRFFPATRERRAAVRRELGLGCQRLILSVGRLAPEKNLVGLLHAWAKIDPSARDGAALVLVGDGPEREKLVATAEALALAGSVKFVGMRDDVGIWYQAADAYVIPSHVEGFSNSMIEALASGLPVISTRVSGSSILEETPAAGLVVDVGDLAGLSSAMRLLLVDEALRAETGTNARRLFEARLSLDSVSKQLIAMYDEMRPLADMRGSA